MANSLGLQGIDFVQFSSPNPGALEDLFLAFGFSKVKKHFKKSIEYFNQEDIHFFLLIPPILFPQSMGLAEC